jgi:hypothetical protein
MDLGDWTSGSGKLADSIEHLRQAWIDRARSSVALHRDIFVYDWHQHRPIRRGDAVTQEARA